MAAASIDAVSATAQMNTCSIKSESWGVMPGPMNGAEITCRSNLAPRSSHQVQLTAIAASTTLNVAVSRAPKRNAAHNNPGTTR